jgi:hypothetical protein
MCYVLALQIDILLLLLSQLLAMSLVRYERILRPILERKRILTQLFCFPSAESQTCTSHKCGL